MIKSFKVKKVAHLPLPWWEKVPDLATKKAFDFHPGLNILWGPNGCGKTTLLICLARILHCEQSGIPRITETSIRNLLDRNQFGGNEVINDVLSSFKLDFDGQPVHFFNPSSTPGLAHGGAAIDDDFFNAETIGGFMAKRSSGQGVVANLGRVLKSVVSLPSVTSSMDPDRVNDLWSPRIRRSLEYVNSANIELGQRTILLDEPDRSLDLLHALELWDLMANEWSAKMQIIVATHNPLVFGIKGVHIIDLHDGYYRSCRDKWLKVQHGTPIDVEFHA